MLGVAIACGWFLAVFHTVHLLSTSYRKLVIFGGTDWSRRNGWQQE